MDLSVTYQSDDITTLAKAILEVQKNLQPAVRDAVNSYAKSKYASLNSVMDACRKPLLDNGILLTQTAVPPPDYMGAGHFGLLTRLIHAESGQWMGSLMIVPLPKTDPQGMGSAITYARRYSLCSMLGIVTEDDDGQGQARQHGTQYGSASAENHKKTGNGNSTGKALPDISGVTYEYKDSTDGRKCVVASGAGQGHEKILKNAGFQWSEQKGIWWKYVG